MSEDSKPRAPSEMAARALEMLSSSTATKLSFRTDLGTDMDVLKPKDRDGKVTMAIWSAVGNRRTERWEMAKISSYLEAGFIFPRIDGVVHDGGHAAMKAAERRATGDLITDMIVGHHLRKLILDGRRAAGRDVEASVCEDVRPSEFNVEAATDILSKAMANIPISELTPVFLPKPTPGEEEGNEQVLRT